MSCFDWFGYFEDRFLDPDYDPYRYDEAREEALLDYIEDKECE